MISFGKNLRQAADPLQKIPLESVYHKIRSPHQRLIDHINQLRTIATIDQKKYRDLKARLPYLVAAIFNPNYRKKVNFAYTHYFILDIDHIGNKDIHIDNLFNKIIKDERVVLAFRSPSNDGIKIFFKLSEKCYDSGKYTLFYKYFATAFSKQYQLDQVLDKSTSDVSRACFVSYDPDAYFNPNAENIIIKDSIDFENETLLSEIVSEIKVEAQELKEKLKKEQIPEKNIQAELSRQDMPIEMLKKIRETLNPKVKEKREKKIFSPEELKEIDDDIISAMQKYDIQVEMIKKIHYGKQYKFKLGYIWAELNIFYGKKGYTIVKTTKNGSDNELAQTCYDILTTIFY